jgi:hypothetical protein
MALATEQLNGGLALVAAVQKMDLAMRITAILRRVNNNVTTTCYYVFLRIIFFTYVRLSDDMVVVVLRSVTSTWRH